MSEYIKVTVDERIMTVKLNRPAKKNALTQDMYQAMTDAIRDAEKRDDVATILLCGEGDAFSAGNDLGDFLRHGEMQPDSPVFQFLEAISTTDVPLIAAVQGAAVGIGTTILLHCDFVYASDDAFFVMPFVDMGLVPEAGSSQLLPLLCGHTRAAELLLLGEPFTASRAKELLIANLVVDRKSLAATAYATARKLARKPHQSLRLSKKLMKAPTEPLNDRIQRELQDFLKVLASEETQKIIESKMKRKQK